MLGRRLSASDMAALAVKASLALDSSADSPKRNNNNKARISPMVLMESTEIEANLAKSKPIWYGYYQIEGRIGIKSNLPWRNRSQLGAGYSRCSSLFRNRLWSLFFTLQKFRSGFAVLHYATMAKSKPTMVAVLHAANGK